MSELNENPVNISSIIVGAFPEQAATVKEQLFAMPGVEVHAVGDDGRMVVSIETDSDNNTVETFERIRQLPGVLSASMVYHQYEPDPDKEA